MRIGFLYGEPARYIRYRSAFEAEGGRLCFEGKPDGCDFLLLPGGGDMEPWRYGQTNRASRDLEPERDEAELELMDRFVTLRKPVFGICRGMQVVNVFFGGTLLQDLRGHDCVNGMDRYHRVRTEGAFFSEIFGKNGVVNSAHHQAVDRLGGGLRAVQWAPDGIVEAVRHETLSVWAVQWHPERLDLPEGRRVIRAMLGVKADL